MLNGISVVTPTLGRPSDVEALIENLGRQTAKPCELILVDGEPGESLTQAVVERCAPAAPFPVVYLRHGGGTAIQRNVGIDRARGAFIAFIDDDMRLEPAFFDKMLAVFDRDPDRRIGGIAGYITNQYFDAAASPRWKWYRRLNLFTTYEPGRYDFETGYPINRYMQPPHEGCREIDFMGSNCAVWRRDVTDSGIRFSEFFTDYGVLEDAHFALRARRYWRLVELGSAHCEHLRSAGGRVSARKVAWKTAVNYRFVFVDIVRKRTLRNELRFWRVQLVDLFRLAAHAAGSRRKEDWAAVLGKAQGIAAAVLVSPAAEPKRPAILRQRQTQP